MTELVEEVGRDAFPWAGGAPPVRLWRETLWERTLPIDAEKIATARIAEGFWAQEISLHAAHGLGLEGRVGGRRHGAC